MYNSFLCPVADIVHALHPGHLILRFNWVDKKPPAWAVDAHASGFICNALNANFRAGQGIILPLSKSQEKVVVPQYFFGSKTLQCRRIEPQFLGVVYYHYPILFVRKSRAMTALFTPYLSTLPVLLTVFRINDIITTQKNSIDADTHDGCLHFVYKFYRRAERT